MVTKARKRPSPKQAKSAPNPPKLSKSDKSLLTSICDSTYLDEISLESWETTHSDLNLTMPLWLDRDAAAEGGAHMVNFTRTIATPSALRQRQAACCSIPVPAGIRDGARVVVKGQGDTLDGKAGDLIVIVHVKR